VPIFSVFELTWPRIWTPNLPHTEWALYVPTWPSFRCRHRVWLQSPRI